MTWLALSLAVLVKRLFQRAASRDQIAERQFLGVNEPEAVAALRRAGAI